MIKPTANSFEYQRRQMVDTQIKSRGVKNQAVLQAFYTVPRECFVLPNYRLNAYEDRPLPTKCSQTISQPYIVAAMTELLELPENETGKILEIGTGSGYQAAILAEMGHKVFSIERINKLAEFAKNNLTEAGYAEWVTIQLGDGCLGCEKEAPFDGIMVTAAAPKIPPKLIEQLKIGAKLIIPCGNNFVQELQQIEKLAEDDIKINHGMGCRFVPLIGKDGF